MPDLTSLTWDELITERRVELAFEKSTYWDLLRWNVATRRMTGSTNPLYGVRIINMANGTKRIQRSVVNGEDSSTRLFRNIQYFYPLDWDDVRYHGLTQNYPDDWKEM